jgi:hypothetical protein
VAVAAAEAVEAGAGADATETESRDTSGPGPLVELRAFALPIVPVRLVLGLAGLAGARVLGVPPDAALALFAFGAGVFLVASFASGRRRGQFWQRVEAAEPVDPTAQIESRARTLVHAAYPSTIGVSALTAIALPIDAALAAVMAGILGGMAVGGLIFAVQLVLWEEREGVRLLATTKGLQTTLFVRSAG